MRETKIFGEDFTVREQKSDRDAVQFSEQTLIVNHNKKPSAIVLKGYLSDLLYSELSKIFEQIEKTQNVEVIGNLDFQVVEKIDGKKERIAKLKGNSILVKLNAIEFPKTVLQYIIAHEVAHIAIKRHTRRFWQTVKLLCPDYEKYQGLLLVSQQLSCRNQ